MVKRSIDYKYIAAGLGVVLIALVIWLIYRQYVEHYSQNDPKLQELKDIFENFFNKERYWDGQLTMLNNRDIMKEINLYRGDKSYTINKEKVYMCLKNNDGEYYDINTLIYVLAHELSHVICDEIGHTEKFHRIFEDLLKEMTDEGIYNPSKKIRTDYCEDGDPEM